ncbi:HotDog domain-containing protein [Suillus ampliporus]|nr:HotDog domain-containing protein [Suillus ampliporus]
MSSRSSPVYASAASPAYESYTPSASSSSSSSSRENHLRRRIPAWVDPESLANCGDASQIQGNVSPYVKQLILNTFIAYGAGDEHCFGHSVAKAVKFVDISVYGSHEKQSRMEATTVAEIVVSKSMLNGAGMLHGGCLAFLIDNTPLVALGLVRNINGVGVTQSMNIMFHSPAPAGSCLRITSTSVAMGARIMSARCEVVNETTGSVVASAYLNKMQPKIPKL